MISYQSGFIRSMIVSICTKYNHAKKTRKRCVILQLYHKQHEMTERLHTLR